ncbi:winged helix-turn-helix transcriptional regulator [Mycoplasmatota bacterium]|nr:winged helix-turn-helix transcriptional regulator [Mycoplasmatota bacterium]
MNSIFKALSDPTRRKIIELLREKDLSAGDISDKFNISKPSISHHLSLLKSSGLIQSERKGQSIIYMLNVTVFQDVVKWFFDVKGGNKHE